MPSWACTRPSLTTRRTRRPSATRVSWRWGEPRWRQRARVAAIFTPATCPLSWLLFFYLPGKPQQGLSLPGPGWLLRVCQMQQLLPVVRCTHVFQRPHLGPLHPVLPASPRSAAVRDCSPGCERRQHDTLARPGRVKLAHAGSREPTWPPAGHGGRWVGSVRSVHSVQGMCSMHSMRRHNTAVRLTAMLCKAEEMPWVHQAAASGCLSV